MSHHAELTDRRFGIPSAPAVLTEPGSLRLSAPGRPALLRAIAPNGTERLSVDALLYTTSSFGAIPKEEGKVRFKVGPFSLFLSTATSPGEDEAKLSLDLSVQWDDDEQFTVAQLGKAAAFSRMLATDGTRVDLVPDARNPTKSVQVTSSGFAIPKEQIDRLNEIECASKVLEKLGLQDTLANGELGQLFPQYTLLDHLLSGEAPEVEVGVDVEQGPHERVAVIMTPCTTIGDLAVVCVVALVSVPRARDHRLFVRGSAVSVGSLEVVPFAELKQFDLATRVKRFGDELEAEHGDSVLVVRPNAPEPLFLLP